MVLKVFEDVQRFVLQVLQVLEGFTWSAGTTGSISSIVSTGPIPSNISSSSESVSNKKNHKISPTWNALRSCLMTNII